MAELTFYDFALDDYHSFKESYDAGFVRNSMGVVAQQCCEKFLKDIICKATNTTDYFKIPVNEKILHDLKSMAFYIRDELGFPNNYEFRNNLHTVQRFYKDTRYPGYVNSHIITADEIRVCAITVKECKKYAEACLELISQKNADKEHIEL